MVTKSNLTAPSALPRAVPSAAADKGADQGDGWTYLCAALTRMVLNAEAGGGENQGALDRALALIAAQHGASVVQIFTPEPGHRLGRVAHWPARSGDTDAPVSFDARDWATLPTRGDALGLAPGAGFPALPDAMVTLVPLLAQGHLAGVLHLARPAGAAGQAAVGPLHHPGFAALGDLMVLLMRTLQRAAGQDLLTGLPDSRGFVGVLARTKPDQEVSVLIVDIDNFRSTKTVLGRSVSDALLRAVSGRLADVLAAEPADAPGAAGTLARSDGDAFAVLLSGGTHRADRVARKFRLALARPFALDQITVYVTASIGISRLSTADETPAALVRQAEVASFAAKTAGGNRQARYSRAMDAQMSRRGQVVQALRHALRTEQFRLAFQPKFTMGADPSQLTLTGAEALLRWDAPDLGEVGPEEFIPIAEASGVITEIDTEVIAIFARQLGLWRRAGRDVAASINLSPRSFEDDTLAHRLLGLLAREGVATARVTVEITETSLISMSLAARSNLTRFRAAGVALSVDDFGTGYSSLGYLQDLIISEIKIDQRYIRPLPPGPGHEGTEKIVRTILTLAQALDIRVVAEGVENAAQAAWLHGAGCRHVQGYLGGRAVGPEMFERLYLKD